MEAHITYTEHGRVLKGSLAETFGATYAEYARLKGRLIRWYTANDTTLLSSRGKQCRVLIGDDVYRIRGTVFHFLSPQIPNLLGATLG